MANFEKFLEYKEKLTDESLQSDLKSFMENFLKQQGRKIIGKTMFRTPVDTGALRASWQLGNIEEKTNSFEITIENNQEYASYVEYGTVERQWKYKDGVYMLTKSINDVEQKINQDFDKEFTKFLKDKGIGE
jgi:hypothetical protein